MFGRKKKPLDSLQAIDESPQADEAVNYNTVVDYLIGLSDRDYKKIFEVAEIYREANIKVTKVLGIKNQPSTSLKEELKPKSADDDLLAGIDLDDEPEFLLDDKEPTEKPLKTKKKINVKS